MSYSTELESKQLSLNIIVKIGEEYYGKRQVDSGLVLPNEHLILDDVSINGVNLDIREATTPIGSASFKLKDESEYITIKIMGDENNFLEKPVEIYAGFTTGSFDWADYKKVATTNISAVTKITNGYSIKTREVTSLVSKPTYNVSDSLSINILAVSTTLTLESAESFPTSGLIRIGREYIRYNGKDGDTLENLIRSQVITVATNHDQGEVVYLVTEMIGQNPIDMILQLMLSKNGDGANDPTYDVYKNGLGLTTDQIEVANFESTRDNFFLGEQFTLYLWGEVDTLKFMERELLKATNCRLFNDDGKINIAVFEQADPTADVIELDESSIVGTPTWTLGSSKIVNVVRMRWGYDDGTGLYTRSTTLRNEDSIAIFGENKPLVFVFKGIKENLDGETIVLKRLNRLLDRLSTPKGAITVKAHFDKSEINIGSNILLTHRFLPKQGAALGINDHLEVMSKNLDLRSALVTFKLEYTSFTGVRIAFIGPSQLIQSVTDQKTFEVADASNYRPGFVLRLFRAGYLPDEVNAIESIVGNIITMAREFDTILATDIIIKMADYPDAIRNQTNRYAYIGENIGKFSDDTKSYQILKS